MCFEFQIFQIRSSNKSRSVQLHVCFIFHVAQEEGSRQSLRHSATEMSHIYIVISVIRLLCAVWPSFKGLLSQSCRNG